MSAQRALSSCAARRPLTGVDDKLATVVPQYLSLFHRAAKTGEPG